MSITVTSPLRAAIVGAGPRSGVYTQIARDFPDRLQITAVVDPDAARRDAIADAFQVPTERRLTSYELLAGGRASVDVAIVCTPDIYHYPACMRLLEDGYDVLLEKPIAPTEQEVRSLIAAAGVTGRVVMVAHTLRYSGFFQALRDHLLAGTIGDLVSMQSVENVGFDHIATTFLRHPRNLLPAPMPMLLSKCCHDLDILAWLAGSTQVQRVASTLRPSQFQPANAPAGSTDRCLRGCAVEPTCVYSARALYVDDSTWGAYPWHGMRTADNDTKLRVLADESPYGRCVWQCVNNAVDYQGVLVQFANGVHASHDLFCSAAEAGRSIRLFGTAGEMRGVARTGEILLRTPDRRRPGRAIERVLRPATPAGARDGSKSADLALVDDFIATVRGDPTARGLSRIQHSLNGHLIAFAADQSAREGRMVLF